MVANISGLYRPDGFGKLGANLDRSGLRIDRVADLPDPAGQAFAGECRHRDLDRFADPDESYAIFGNIGGHPNRAQVRDGHYRRVRVVSVVAAGAGDLHDLARIPAL